MKHLTTAKMLMLFVYKDVSHFPLYMSDLVLSTCVGVFYIHVHTMQVFSGNAYH